MTGVQTCALPISALMVEANVPFTDICKNLEDLRPQIDTYYYVDTLEYLIQGGRIGKVQGTIGKFLNIKPIISIDNDGVYYTIEKARGKNQAYNKLYSLLKNISNCLRSSASTFLSLPRIRLLSLETSIPVILDINSYVNIPLSNK